MSRVSDGGIAQGACSFDAKPVSYAEAVVGVPTRRQQLQLLAHDKILMADDTRVAIRQAL